MIKVLKKVGIEGSSLNKIMKAIYDKTIANIVWEKMKAFPLKSGRR
jgi:hypothetical protein